MIYKAFIEEIPKNNSNEYKVRVPFLEDNTGTKMIYSALLCSQPGVYNGYSVGDCVYVTYETHETQSMVILGKLYVDVTKSNSQYLIDNLEVTGAASLPINTLIGPYSAKDISKLYQISNALQEGTGNNFLYDVVEEW